MFQIPAKLKCPITAFYEAEEDSFGVKVEDVETWEKFSLNDKFDCIPIHGPHLFLLEQHNEAELLEQIKDTIKQDLSKK